ncbi:xaa-Pro aminopeptidase family enzyme [Lasiosphaeria ovina]|uniref:Xaa-Pro aminopeptidase family enzyme n=1 Tax=Lasiosphaeria ovina TaxID=92902 RepID=A0AAE0JVJ6_9PEZI|nr:xaa-Pro aminopeptidase family enzyme [Lasiosphaeria ovina]
MRIHLVSGVFAAALVTIVAAGDAQVKLGPSEPVLESPAQWPHLPRYYTLPSLREQAEIQDAWTQERRAKIPALLKKYGVDAWLISQREYAEETVFWSLKSAREFSARRRTTLLFLAESDNSTAASAYKWIDNTPGLWSELRGVLAARDPQTIAINTSPDISFSSGLHAGELEAVSAGIGKRWAARFVSKPMLAVEYIATMTESRAIWYRRLQSTAWAMISEAFSSRVIMPGVTTTTDVEWWLRERIQQMNYTTWFHPDVTVIDEHAFNITAASSAAGDAASETARTIHPGDLLHVDFGVTALGLNTDTQHLGYVLRPGEADAPAGFVAGLRKANRAQDVVKAHMVVGRCGNDILAAALAQLRAEGIDAKVYSHPIGDWGHAAGTLIGMTNLQDGVPVLGELPLLPSTYYSVELLVEHFVPERGATLRFPLEEDILHVPADFDARGRGDKPESEWIWVYGRQEQFHLVRSPLPSASDGKLGVQAEDL